ncbi:4-(cytidine 5'-diphospho)-2-C-methyl-D-erythritol kinase [Parvularcula flava]|uniref:4-diphosphocytidyl-2-C-methyl-D-erythritol kinase n=1 Tax=Aquisalinus luteolus TaxID=1566827 RepID=A0A8J3A4W2_9PROT|nr:4-(cytidine 5'-diphospho)-2-C-methyl-D-erythritol kinase [Aquisalinus luteolus]NHK28759.1 4-(cytidine 5'-diphospho)-2-C-methyl-D-erythritol kinase [Aquisalinus luteolus]GGH99434.1 4-diphosphocytidyl-2-C-methyl-D-erythritol kinase [Aquisalinus luteolus]
MAELLARAKVNLCLHVGATRPDGLHDIFSLAVFPMLGDRLVAEPSDYLSLTIDGHFAGALAGLAPASNLVLRAARLLQGEPGGQGTVGKGPDGKGKGARLRLTKNLPPASGIGGGTADAAAAMVLLRDLWGLKTGDQRLMALSFLLGADGPLCLAPHLLAGRAGALCSAIATGAGEQVRAGPVMAPFWMLLVNPGQAVSTAAIFRLYDADPPAGPADRVAFGSSCASLQDLGSTLALTRNDLAGPAISLCPAIRDVLSFLERQPGCSFSRMSGSGATCFGLFSSQQAARKAASAARGRGWWAESAAAGPTATGKVA